MPTTPLVSIVIPVFNDEDTISAAIDSCLAQTLGDIEIVCVDDASSDESVAVIERYQAKDERIRLVRHSANLSAFQARRSGILASRAEHLLFLDGDDQLDASAARAAHAKAVAEDADLVGFGVRIVRPDGASAGAFERRLQPRHQSLNGVRVLQGLFPQGQPASGQLWRYMFRTDLLRTAYALLPEDLVIPRANDVPLMFLAAALAKKYVSISDRLYRYQFGAGRSGQAVDRFEDAAFFASAITAIESISDAVREIAYTSADPGVVIDSYESVRLSILGHTCKYLVAHTREDLLPSVLTHLADVASSKDVVLACARFAPELLTVLKAHSQRIELSGRPVRNILLSTMVLRTGGVSGVLLAQARIFLAAGYKVTIVARRAGSDLSAVPDGADFVELEAGDRPSRLAEWAFICQSRQIDVVIDHQILYTRDWPELALSARSVGAATIGWIHNFAGRPVYDLKDLHSLMKRDLHLLAKLVVLSPLDVAFWKLRDVEHVVYLPNPPSPMLLNIAGPPAHKRPPLDHVELVWWGRLEQRTKQVLQLLEVATALDKLRIPFHLKVIGPEWDGLTIDEFNTLARKLGVGDRIEATGPRHGDELIKAIDAAHVALSTSVIEGYPLTMVEAQARGLPVFMYELPWLALLDGNNGVVSVPQGDAAGLAAQIARLTTEENLYEALSRGSLEAADRALAFDFAQLYEQLISDTLPPQYSPEPTIEESKKLIDLLIFFSERNAGLLQKVSDSATQSRTPRKPGSKRKVVAKPQGVSNQRSLGSLAWRAAKPIGRRFLITFPTFRPVAHRWKQRLVNR